jgi:ABC-type dipeptide/oligopeptide/nickel transport system permease subunit
MSGLPDSGHGWAISEYTPTSPSGRRLEIIPGIAVSLAVFGFSLFGDAVRDELDAKLRSR